MTHDTVQRLALTFAAGIGSALFLAASASFTLLA
jgi:hypothetical protein